MKKLIVTITLATMLVSGTFLYAKTLKTENDKVSYAMGMNIMLSFKTQEITLNEKIFIGAIRDVLRNKKLTLTEGEMQQILQKFSQNLKIKQRAKAVKDYKIESKAGQKFHAKKKKEKGVVTLPGGLQYKIKKKGTGKKPGIGNTVKVHYQGTVIDGKEFDSSYKRGTPATFPLKGVIKGWTQILQLMPEGSIWEVYIPENLAYGQNPPPGGIIKAGSSLIFKIELLSIVK